MDIRVLFSPPFFVRLTSTLLIMPMHRSLVLLLFFFMVAIRSSFYMREQIQCCHSKRLFMSKVNKPPLSLSRLIEFMKGKVKNDKIFIRMEVMKIDMVFARKLCWEKLLAVNVGVKLYLGIRFKGGFDMRSVRDLVNKRGCGKIDGQKVPLTDNNIYGILNIEGIVSEITLLGCILKRLSTFRAPSNLTSQKKPAISIVLGFIGSKMILDFFGYHVPSEVSPGCVATCLGGGVLLSLMRKSSKGTDEGKKSG
ncbi:hypothetical protein NE237_017607 [Protea cynaroides]|uniref:Large ribosomal subunit protein uL15/eL18 domain-containing protein n=1 Tax=Protea cynaroides TaxID=273540 RepID=A0A9Q0QN77_9MAGN|nr:hypothetical protein NE237_017607 [Protea cynaroides]